MGRFFITGSSDGLGLLTAKKLIASGHSVVLHARNAQRARDASAACPGAEAVLTADLSSVDEIASLAFEADRYGPYECIVHNAGVFTDTSRARDGYGRECSTLFVVNLLAPWMLTCLMKPPTRRLVYVSSGMHRQGRLGVLLDEERIRTAGYGDTKLAMVMLAKAVARKWGGVDSSRKGIEAYSADPGWVPTKMGGSSAPGDLGAGVDNFVRVALGPHGQLDRGGEELKNGRTRRNGGYWYNSKEENPLRDAEDEEKQDALLDVLKKVTGIGLPDLSNSREKILQV